MLRISNLTLFFLKKWSKVVKIDDFWRHTRMLKKDISWETHFFGYSAEKKRIHIRFFFDTFFFEKFFENFFALKTRLTHSLMPKTCPKRKNSEKIFEKFFSLRALKELGLGSGLSRFFDPGWLKMTKIWQFLDEKIDF